MTYQFNAFIAADRAAMLAGIRAGLFFALVYVHADGTPFVGGVFVTEDAAHEPGRVVRLMPDSGGPRDCDIIGLADAFTESRTPRS